MFIFKLIAFVLNKLAMKISLNLYKSVQYIYTLQAKITKK